MFLLFVAVAAVLVFLAHALDLLGRGGMEPPAPPAGTGMPR